MCHRFVRITAPSGLDAFVKQKMADYNAMMQRDQGIKLIKLQSDAEATGNPSNSQTSYTIMVVQEFSANDDDVEKYQKGMLTVIGQ